MLSGPSGVGKTTVVRELRRRHRHVWVSVSVTTRHPRPGERDGIDYWFVSPQRFSEMASRGELLEWAEFAGNSYGTPLAPVLEHVAAGVPVLLEIEIEGARQVRARMPDALLVFLRPPSWDELVRRLTGRGTESPEVVAARLDRARVELAAEAEFDVALENSAVGSVCDRLLALMGSSHSSDRKAT